jgi:endonuclease/exonuclease/phosphatase family metal-dependent hydrolase
MALLNVATYNIKHCDVGGGKIDLKRVAAMIKSLGCGLVALQEVDNKTSRSGGVDQTRELARYAGFPHYAFGKSRDYGGGQYGNAILSHIPFVAKRTLRIPGVNYTLYNEDRCILCVDVTPEGKQLQFCSTHWGFQEAQSAAMDVCIRVFAGGGRDNTCIAGDFNCGVGSLAFQCMNLHWTPALDIHPIDNFYVRSNVRLLSHAVVPDGTPDHSPVVGVIEVN